MKTFVKHVLLATAAVAVAAPASAAPIVGLFNTGGGTPGSADPHWTLAGGTAFDGTSLNGNWIANNSTSQWLTPRSNGGTSLDPTADGLYSYSLVFSLAGLDPSSASFAGRFLVDNSVDTITLNGVTIVGSGGTFTGWTNFSSIASAFVAGNNTLTFNTRNFRLNGGNPAGLRVEFLQSNALAVPEAATWAMLIFGLGAVGAGMRARRTSVRFA